MTDTDEYFCGKCGFSSDSDWSLDRHIGEKHPETLPYNDEEELERLYVDEGLTVGEIADRMGCTHSTIYRKIKEFGIKRPPNPWEDSEEIERLYWEEELTTYEIADRMGCNATTISNKMKEFGIEKRSQSYRSHLANPAHSNPAIYVTDKERDYEYWNDCRDENQHQTQVYVHQLLACLNHDPHEVFAEDTAVHHGNNQHSHLPGAEHSLANWEGNLEVMTNSEHNRYHANQQWERRKNCVQHNSAMEW